MEKSQPNTQKKDETQDRAWTGWLTQVATRAESIEKGIQTFVRDRPLAVLLGAVAIGFVVDRISQMNLVEES